MERLSMTLPVCAKMEEANIKRIRVNDDFFIV
jgi:hypothetical protein